MNDTPAPAPASTPTRPTAITVICILGFIGAALTIPLIFSSAVQSIASWYPPYLGASAVVGLICLIGLWKMKKWAVFLYTLLVVINQVVLFTAGLWNPFALLIPVIVIAIGFANLSKMT